MVGGLPIRSMPDDLRGLVDPLREDLSIDSFVSWPPVMRAEAPLCRDPHSARCSAQNTSRTSDGRTRSPLMRYLGCAGRLVGGITKAVRGPRRGGPQGRSAAAPAGAGTPAALRVATWFRVTGGREATALMPEEDRARTPRGGCLGGATPWPAGDSRWVSGDALSVAETTNKKPTRKGTAARRPLYIEQRESMGGSKASWQINDGGNWQ